MTGLQDESLHLYQAFLSADADHQETVISDEHYTSMCSWWAVNKAWSEPIIIAYETAMHRGEIMALQPEWFDFNHRCITLPEEICKNGQSRKGYCLRSLWLFWNGWSMKALNVFLIALVSSTWVLIMPAGTGLNIKDAVFHSLRHTSISRYAKVPGINIFTLSAIYGHADPAELKTYFHSDASYSIAQKH